MKFYISISDKYLSLLRGFSYMFNKYWCYPNQETIVLGYKFPNFDLPSNFKFISLNSIDPGISKWTNYLIDYFNSINDDYFGWTFENIWMASPHNKDMIDFLINELEENKIQKVILDQHETPDNVIFTEYNKEFGLFLFDKKSVCKCSLITQIVKRDFFLKYLLPNKTPWQYEQEGQIEALKDDSKVLFTSIKTSPKIADIMNKGRVRSNGRLGIKNLNNEDLIYLRQNKMINF